MKKSVSTGFLSALAAEEAPSKPLSSAVGSKMEGKDDKKGFKKLQPFRHGFVLQGTQHSLSLI